MFERKQVFERIGRARAIGVKKRKGEGFARKEGRDVRVKVLGIWGKNIDGTNRQRKSREGRARFMERWRPVAVEKTVGSERGLRWVGEKIEGKELRWPSV